MADLRLTKYWNLHAISNTPSGAAFLRHCWGVDELQYVVDGDYFKCNEFFEDVKEDYPELLLSPLSPVVILSASPATRKRRRENAIMIAGACGDNLWFDPDEPEAGTLHWLECIIQYTNEQVFYTIRALRQLWSVMKHFKLTPEHDSKKWSEIFAGAAWCKYLDEWLSPLDIRLYGRKPLRETNTCHIRGFAKEISECIGAVHTKSDIRDDDKQRYAITPTDLRRAERIYASAPPCIRNMAESTDGTRPDFKTRGILKAYFLDLTPAVYLSFIDQHNKRLYGNQQGDYRAARNDFLYKRPPIGMHCASCSTIMTQRPRVCPYFRDGDVRGARRLCASRAIARSQYKCSIDQKGFQPQVYTPTDVGAMDIEELV